MNQTQIKEALDRLFSLGCVNRTGRQWLLYLVSESGASRYAEKKARRELQALAAELKRWAAVRFDRPDDPKALEMVRVAGVLEKF